MTTAVKYTELWLPKSSSSPLIIWLRSHGGVKHAFLKTAANPLLFFRLASQNKNSNSSLYIHCIWGTSRNSKLATASFFTYSGSPVTWGPLVYSFSRNGKQLGNCKSLRWQASQLATDEFERARRLFESKILLWRGTLAYGWATTSFVKSSTPALWCRCLVAEGGTQGS